MHLLIGLGNIGSKYAKTRHNFGFLALDQIIADYRFTKMGEKFSSEVFVGEIKIPTKNNSPSSSNSTAIKNYGTSKISQKIIALKPQTYMNNSGIAALEAMQFYKIPPQNIIVFHDEIDIPLGKVKVKLGGGSAGHNGLKSLDSIIGKEYWRVRLGVGRPENKEFEVADYVLSKFTKDEMIIAQKINQKIAQEIDLLISGDTNLFANKIAL